jgi:hypothetical protein
MLAFIIGILATYGIAYTITALEGPFGVFAMLQGYAQRRPMDKRNWIEKGLLCVLCVSFWVGIPIAILLCGLTVWAAMNWLGYLGASVIITVALNRLRTVR